VAATTRDFPQRTGVIYAHGSGWRVGDKDMLTRHFFPRLAGQGHLVLDIAYTLRPEADIPTMVSEVNQAILWLKNNSSILGLDPEGIVLMGGSAARKTLSHTATKTSMRSVWCEKRNKKMGAIYAAACMVHLPKSNKRRISPIMS